MRRSKRNPFRRLLAALLFVVLLLVDLLLVGYLSRDLWLEPLVRDRAAAWIGEALGQPVELGPLRGSWIRDLKTTLHTTGAAPANAVVSRIEDLQLVVGFDLPGLLRGDLAGLRGVRAEAARVDVRLPESSASTETTTTPEWPDLAPFEPWLDALPAGANVRIRRLVVTASDGRTIHDGPVRIDVEHGHGIRIAVAHARGDVEVLIHRRPTLEARITAHVEDPGELLRGFGVRNDLRAGTLQLIAHVDVGTPSARARLAWEGGQLRGRGAASIHADVAADRFAVRGDVDVDLPGLTIEGDALRVPLPNPALETLRGAVTVDVRGTGSWQTWLPDEVRGYLPATGRVHAEIGGGVLRVGRSRLEGKDWALTVSSGELPANGAGGRLFVTAELGAPRRFALGESDSIVVQGRATGELTGSFEAPRFRGGADLGGGGVLGWDWESASATVAFDGQTVSISDADVQGFRPTGEPKEVGARYTGDVTVQLPDSTVPRPLALDADGTLTAATLAAVSDAPAFASLSPGAVRVEGRVSLPSGELPIGEFDVRAGDVRAGADRAPSDLHVRGSAKVSDGNGRSFDVTANGSVDPVLARLLGIREPLLELATNAKLDAHATGAFAAGASWPPSVELKLDLDGVALGETPASHLVLDASLSPTTRNVDIARLQVDGPATLSVEGTLPLGNAPADLTVHANAPDLGLLSKLVPSLPATGHASVTAHVKGPLEQPDVEAEATVAVPNLGALGVVWPAELGDAPDGAVSVSANGKFENGVLTLHDTAATVGTQDAPDLRIQLSGSPPLGWNGSDLVARGGDPALTGSVSVRREIPSLGAMSADAKLEWSEAALALNELAVHTPHGDAKGTFSVTRLADAIANGSIGQAPLSGKLDLDALDLGGVPADWARSLALTGKVSGEVRVTGSLAAPRPEGTVSLRGGEAKLMAAAPTMTDIEGKVELTDSKVTLSDLKGHLGVGVIRVSGDLTADQGALLDHLDRAKLHMDIVADNALIVRSTGMKIRADSKLAVDGRLDSMLVKGNFDIGYGKIIRRISLVPDLARRGGMGVQGGLSIPRIPPPFGQALRFEVEIHTKEPIDVVTHVLDAPVEVALHLRGTGADPQLDGAISASRGKLKMPAITFGIQTALLAFTPANTRYPDLRVVATARRQSIDLTATASGRIDAVEVYLSSIPPLSQSDLFVLASTGQLPAQLNQAGVAGQATLVGGYLATEIFDFYFGSDSTESGASFIDRFHFYSGREIGQNGNESMTVDFDLNDRFALQAEQDIYEDYNMGVVYRIRF